MNNMRSLAAGVFAAAAFAAAPLHGQAATCAPAAPPVTHMALEHRQELGISAAQVRRLEVIDARLKGAGGDAHAGHGAASAGGDAHAGHGQASTGGNAHAGHGQASGGEASEHAAYNAASAAQVTRANTEARAVLTARQRTQLDALHARHHGAASARGGANAPSCAAPAAAHSHG